MIVADYDVITPYGIGLEFCWDGLLRGQSAIKQMSRFSTEHFISSNAALVPNISVSSDDSFVMQMLRKLLIAKRPSLPENTKLFLATTAGEIDLPERDIFRGEENAKNSNIRNLLSKVETLFGIREGSGILVSAACASSTAAIARAGMMISSGEIDSALVVACDSVSEFVFSGFSALMAMDKDFAKPFDKDRNGLSLGEAAGWVLLMSEECAKQNKVKSLGKISGWGFSSDAYHMTGPSPDGSGLANAISKAIGYAKKVPSDIGIISAHGTGTQYNDTMEINAFLSVFDNPVPTYSIKGGTGHTLATAGLLETLIASKSMEEKIVPPTINFSKPGNDIAPGWISSEKQNPASNKYALKVNSGFGGINVALVLTN